MFSIEPSRILAVASLFLVFSAGAASPDRWQPKPGTAWQIQFTGPLDTSVIGARVYNLDLFDTPAEVISKLHAEGKKVICYFSAGSYEKWRPDAERFPAEVLGWRLSGWPGEKWLNVKRQDILLPIMKDRIALAAKKRCDAVDPDNVDGYANRTGFRLTYKDQLAYNAAIAKIAHEHGLAVGLKNNLEQVKDLHQIFDFAVNEECFSYGECEMLLPFVKAGKAVFGIEYGLSTSQFCADANRMNFDFLKKEMELTAWRQACR